MNNPNDVFKHLSVSEISDFENIELIPINGEGMGSDDKMGVLSDELPILPIRNIVFTKLNPYAEYNQEVRITIASISELITSNSPLLFVLPYTPIGATLSNS